jgi:serine/threonine-protein kinase
MGTPLYMSPEQVEGRPLDCRSDIYSLGVTCYHLLAGQPPFRGQTAFEVALQHVQAQPRPLQEVRADLPTELCAIVGKMMAKNPDSRYQTCRELLRDLASVRDRPMGATADGVVAVSLIAGAASVPAGRTTTLAARHPRRRWLGWLVAASLLTSAMAGAGLAWMQLRKQAQPTPPNAATDLGNLEALFSKQKHEQFLKDAVEQYANPGDDAARVRLGTGHNIELALLYLEQWRLDEAGEFFQKLLKSPVEQYADLGRLGHAIVLALGNRAAESNREFLELLKDKRGRRVTPRAGLIFFDNPQLAQWVGRALDYNAANLAPEAMPSELAPFQKPWTGPNKRPGNGKVPGKGKQPDSVE